MPDLVIPTAMALLGLVTAWSVYKAWSPSRKASTRAHNGASDRSSPSTVESSLDESTRTLNPPRAAVMLMTTGQSVPAAWTRFTAWIGLGLVGLVAAGTAVVEWLASSAGTSMRTRTLVVVIAWGIAIVAGVVLALTLRRSQDGETPQP